MQKQEDYSPFLQPFDACTPTLSPMQQLVSDNFSLDTPELFGWQRSPMMPAVTMPSNMRAVSGMNNMQHFLLTPETTPTLAPYMPVTPSQLLNQKDEVQQRRSVHKEAEQRRRDILKGAFEGLRHSLLIAPDLTYSKVALLQKGITANPAGETIVSQRVKIAELEAKLKSQSE
jgi:hypothetical protein